MGEVYRAQDLALGREAAVKLLSPGMADALRDRLVHEARTSARLQFSQTSDPKYHGQVCDHGFRI